MEDKIKELIEESLASLGLEVVKVTFQGGSRKILEVLIDRLDGGRVQVKDCKDASRTISAIMDVEDVIKDKYFLEISSAGVERPLVKLQDFERFVGRDVKVRLKEPHNNNSSFKGKIVEVKGDDVVIKSKNVTLTFAYNNIKGANLVLTDEMFKKILSENKGELLQ